MKYIIITLVIAAILAILSYILDLTNDKYDKYFLVLVGGILILSGLYFSIKSEALKEKEEIKKVEKIDITLDNTKNIKTKADSIIYNLNESLEKTLTLSNSISKQNKTLSNVEHDIKTQIKTLNNTLKQTELFEKKVKEQLEIEKKRFESEKPNVNITISYSIYNNPNHYRLLYDCRNDGKRAAKNLKVSGIIVFGRNKKTIGHMILKNSEHENLEVPINKNRRLILYSQEKFSIKEIDTIFSEALIKIRFSYYDSYSNNKIVEEKTFAWFGKKESGLKFHFANKEWSETINDYIIKNNLDF
ncbi:hypothetical protein [Flavivirga jejuensis]|uniref:GIY-YIG nuclease family protein n=1 Tax=Flavivirga jejuensis TaxID=870487 RepID=A0ABT8WI93_9FLAO|nr:hypothetical protein [Flavivirga jejuensis]MDO5972868.1 hypothetical protein [Flavivirga jejuensis]